MDGIIRSIYKGMLGEHSDFFLWKFAAVRDNKGKGWEILRRIKITDTNTELK